MTKLDCGCRIMSEYITLSECKQPHWPYLLKTFMNMCGKCGKKQMKFQEMENKLLEIEKARMKMFLDNESSDDKDEEDTYFDLKELKDHLKEMTPEKRKDAKQFEQLRNLATGRDKNEGIDEIDKVIKELEEEEKELWRHVPENYEYNH